MTKCLGMGGLDKCGDLEVGQFAVSWYASEHGFQGYRRNINYFIIIISSVSISFCSTLDIDSKNDVQH